MATREQELQTLTDGELLDLEHMLRQISIDADACLTWSYYGRASRSELTLVRAEKGRRRLYESWPVDLRGGAEMIRCVSIRELHPSKLG